VSQVHCGSCQLANPPVAKFCMGCGSGLAQAAAPAGLRFVTVAFCDIAGSTQLALRFDPQVWHGILEGYFGGVGGALVAAGGRLEKFIGDAVVGVFGADASGEDDALNTVRGALAALDALRELNDRTVARHGVRLSIRFGIASGRVVMADRDSSFAIGSVMNRAARLQSAAPPDGAVVDVRTWLLVRDQLRCEPVAPVPAKGFAKPLQAWSVTAEPPKRPAPVFVNQADVLHRLTAAVGGATQAPGVTSIALVGEAGSGKSRVLAHLADDLRHEDLHVLRLSATRAEENQVVWRLQQICRALGAPAAGASTAELQWLIRRAMCELSRLRPLVVLIDDHNRMPPAVRELRQVGPACGPIVFVLAGRDEPPACEVAIRVPALADKDAQALLSALSGEVELHVMAAAVDRLVRRGRGNPLFLEQLAALAAEGTDDDVAPSAEALLGARLDRLTHPARHLLACVGAWGRPVAADDLEAVCGLDEPAVAAGLDELETQALTGNETAAEVAYLHMVLADRAKVHVAIARRLQAYGRTDPAMLDPAGAHAVRGWRHWRELAPGSADALASARVAGSCLAAAARHAIARSEVRRAAELCAQAAELDHGDDALTLELAALETYALGAGGQVAQALARIDAVRGLSGNPSAAAHLAVTEMAFRTTAPASVRDLARATGDPCANARLDAWEGVRAARDGDYRRAEELLRSAYQGIRGFDPGLGVTEVYANLALFLAYGDTPLQAALDRCEALRAEVAGAPILHAVVSCSTALLLQMSGDSVGARDMLSAARTVFVEMGHSLGEAGAWEIAGTAAQLAGDPAEGRAHVERARQGYERAGAQQAALRCARQAFVLDPAGTDPAAVPPATVDAGSSREARILAHEIGALRDPDRAAEHLDRAFTEIEAVRGYGALLVLVTGYLHVAGQVGHPPSLLRAHGALTELRRRRATGRALNPERSGLWSTSR